MSTRSRIGVMHGTNCKSVYCHSDGYLDYNGRMLLEHYDSTKANFLVALGDLSSLGSVIGQAHPFSQFEIKNDDPEREAKLALLELAKAEGWCTFYGRDRGETGCDWATDTTFEAFLERADQYGAEYYYIMRDGEWFVGTTYKSDTKLGGKLVPLAEALAEQDIETATSNWEQVTV
jgi:hypothetical protein